SDRRPKNLRRPRGNAFAPFGFIRSSRLVMGAIGVIGLATAASTASLLFRNTSAVIELENLPDRAEVHVDGRIVAIQWPDADGHARIAVHTGSRDVLVKDSGKDVYHSRIEVGSERIARANIREGSTEPPSGPDDKQRVVTKAPEVLRAPCDEAA